MIGSHNKLANVNHQFDVKTDEHSLERAKTCKYLCIDLDESLSWDSHIDNIAWPQIFQTCQELGSL